MFRMPRRGNGGKAPKKKAKASKKSNNVVVPRRVRRSVGSIGISSHVANYAKLLGDPCAGPLGSYFGGAHGIVQRFQGSFSVATAAGSTAAVLCISGNNSPSVGWANLANDTTAATLTYSQPDFPGATYCNTNSRGWRIVAMCARLFPQSSDMNNSGFVGAGNVPVSELPAQGVASSAAGVFQSSLPMLARLPTSGFEVRWMPGEGDATYYDLNTASGPPKASSNGIIVALTGLPAGVGVKVVLTTVIEWLPRETSGLVATTIGSSPWVDLGQVQSYLASRSANWWYRFGSGLGGLLYSFRGNALRLEM